jgi:hypothetical protein
MIDNSSTPCAANLRICLLAIALLAPPRTGFSQGCIPAHYMSLSLGAQGIQYLDENQWEADVSYRYLHSEHVFIGTHEQPQLHDVGGRNTINSFDIAATYAISSRFSVTLTVPVEHDDFSLIQDDHERHGGSSFGIGDARLVADAWLFSPHDNPYGNVSLGLGIKLPTGDDDVTAPWHEASGAVINRPVDIAAQLGDGGVGAVAEIQAFQRLVENLYAYAAGFYLFNPRDVNGTQTPSPIKAHVNSVPDQYFGRAGLSYVIWPSGGLALSLGGRIDGIPVHDAFGASDGFRRAGYAMYIDPGINWSMGKNSLSINVPVAFYRDLEQTSYSKAGAFADFLVVASYSRSF